MVSVLESIYVMNSIYSELESASELNGFLKRAHKVGRVGEVLRKGKKS